MKKKNEQFLPAEIKNTEKLVVIYRSSDGEVQLDVILYNETLWLNVFQMSQLFDRDEKTVRKHIKKALLEELRDEVVVANFATTTASDNSSLMALLMCLRTVFSSLPNSNAI